MTLKILFAWYIFCLALIALTPGFTKILKGFQRDKHKITGFVEWATIVVVVLVIITLYPFLRLGSEILYLTKYGHRGYFKQRLPWFFKQ